jgi:hypothetical protein
MVYDGMNWINLDYWVFGLCSSSDILKNTKEQRFGNWIGFRPQVMGWETLLAPLERADLAGVIEVSSF